MVGWWSASAALSSRGALEYKPFREPAELWSDLVPPSTTRTPDQTWRKRLRYLCGQVRRGISVEGQIAAEPLPSDESGLRRLPAELRPIAHQLRFTCSLMATAGPARASIATNRRRVARTTRPSSIKVRTCSATSPRRRPRKTCIGGYHCGSPNFRHGAISPAKSEPP